MRTPESAAVPFESAHLPPALSRHVQRAEMQKSWETPERAGDVYALTAVPDGPSFRVDRLSNTTMAGGDHNAPGALDERRGGTRAHTPLAIAQKPGLALGSRGLEIQDKVLANFVCRAGSNPASSTWETGASTKEKQKGGAPWASGCYSTCSGKCWLKD